ncbi:MAG TPA: PDZ domain-containing protein, partial [Phycisphaerales bacterium]|nr:PDZ domain-containing protein [Phycisphaerales bacterium]
AGRAEPGDGKEAPSRFNYDRRLTGGAANATPQPAQVRPRSNSVAMYQSSENGRTYTARIENGEVVSAQIDGTDVPPDRVRQGPSSIEFLGSDGSVLHSMKVASPPTPPLPPLAPSARRSIPDIRGLDERWADRMATLPGEIHVEISPPPVMLGITMSRPDEAIAQHLGVKADEVVRVDSVIEGLPAAAAGLRENDVIVAIDGSKPISESSLREALRSKKPGESMRLTVISRGKTQDVSVTLASFDQERLSGWTTALPRGGGTSRFLPYLRSDVEAEGAGELLEFFTDRSGPVPQKIEEARRALEEAIARLRAAGEMTAESIKTQAIEGMQRAIEALQATSLQSEVRRRSIQGAPSSPEVAGRAESVRPQVFIAPVPGAPSEMMDRLSATIERLDQRLVELERLEKRLMEHERRMQGGSPDGVPEGRSRR